MRLLVAALLTLSLLPGQETPAPEKPKPAPPPPTNLKILKVTSGVEVRQIMRTFNAGLGVQCIFCHVEKDFSSDGNPKKEVARHMIEMTQQINARFPDGKMHVSCFTCHRGEAEPKTAPEASK